MPAASATIRSLNVRSALTEPFQAEFVRNGAITAALVGVLCGVVGCHIAAASAPIGLLLSWHLDIAAGASIVLVPVSAFVVVLIARPA